MNGRAMVKQQPTSTQGVPDDVKARCPTELRYAKAHRGRSRTPKGSRMSTFITPSSRRLPRQWMTKR